METPQPHRMKIVIEFDVLTGKYSLDGCDQNPVAALWMLDYAIGRVKQFLVRLDVEREMAEAQRNASRIVPGSAFRQ